MSTIKIKLLSGFPIYTYEEINNYNEVVQINFLCDVSATSDMWGHVYDNLKTNRVIQSINYNVFEISQILAQNINVALLTSANHVYIETENYGNFYATHLEIEKENTNTRDSFYKIKFRQQLSINYELSSDFAERLHPNLPVNVLNYKIINPPYVFNNTTISNVSLSKALFKVDLNELTDTIQINDVFYLHSDNVELSQLTDDDGGYLNFAKAISKDINYVYFECSNDVITIPNSNDIINLELNNIETHPAIPTGITINEKEIEFNIYTFLNTFTEPFNEVKETIEKKNYENITGKSVNSKILNTKIWLKDEDLFKATYLRYSNEIKYTQTDGAVIIPISKTEVIKTVKKDTLINVHEFDIRFEIEHQTFCNLNENIY